MAAGRILVLLCLSVLLGFSSGCAALASAGTDFNGLTEEQLQETFRDYDASFVLLDKSSGKFLRLRPAACDKRLSPCSTFKIFNSLAGLDTAVVRNENHTFVWDGTKYDISDWNRDQTLQSAVSNSVVWYFQRVASLVGEERMKKFIDKVGYGNRDISGGITKFWLGDSLKISANEQVLFLSRLLDDDLPFSPRSTAIVRGMLRLDQTANGTLYGKTGSHQIAGKDVLGWFVGYVVRPGKVYVFASNIQAADRAYGKKARQLTESILRAVSIL